MPRQAPVWETSRRLCLVHAPTTSARRSRSRLSSLPDCKIRQNIDTYNHCLVPVECAEVLVYMVQNLLVAGKLLELNIENRRTQTWSRNDEGLWNPCDWFWWSCWQWCQRALTSPVVAIPEPGEQSWRLLMYLHTAIPHPHGHWQPLELLLFQSDFLFAGLNAPDADVEIRKAFLFDMTIQAWISLHQSLQLISSMKQSNRFSWPSHSLTHRMQRTLPNRFRQHLGIYRTYITEAFSAID